MEKKDLQDLLKRYYDGKTSPSEENGLIRFFTGNDVPEGFEAEKKLFAYLAKQSGVHVPVGLEERMSQFVDRIAEKNTFPNRVFHIYRNIAAVAAVVALLVVAYFGFLRNPARDTFDDPALAYAETQKVLYYISENLNTGTSRMKLLAEAGKSVDELGKLNTLNTQVNELKKMDALTRGLEKLQNAQVMGEEIISKYLITDNKK